MDLVEHAVSRNMKVRNTEEYCSSWHVSELLQLHDKHSAFATLYVHGRALTVHG